MKKTSSLPLSSLWETVLKQFNENLKDCTPFNGICYAIQRATIYGHDYHRLEQDRIDNKPSLFKHPEFFKHDSFTGGTYWWMGKGETQQRIKFMKKMIKLNLEKEKECQQSESQTSSPTTS